MCSVMIMIEATVTHHRKSRSTNPEADLELVVKRDMNHCALLKLEACIANHVARLTKAVMRGLTYLKFASTLRLHILATAA